jgi:hypothetical protein
MSSSDAVTEAVDEGNNGFANTAGSLAESLAPALARHARSGNLAAASGAVSLVRAGRTFLKGERKRGLLQAAAGLFWVGVALAQRRAGGDAGTGSSGPPSATDAVDTSPDIESAVEPGERDTDHATGEEVVDTADADVPSDDASEVGVADDMVEDVAAESVDQTDVAGSDDIESAASDGEEDGETSDDAEADAESADDSDASEDDEATADADERAETSS